jgi:hypothetical protein
MGCSGSKAVTKGERNLSAADNSLLSKETGEVTTRLGEPTSISKTPEGRILWVYEPRMKLIPNSKGTVYVEFEDGKVVKVFKIK